MKKVSLLVICLAVAGIHGKSLLIDKPPTLYRTASSTLQFFKQVAKKNEWDLTLKDVEIDTVGSFDINGLPVHVINLYGLDQVDYEEFYMVYTAGGKVRYSLLSTTAALRKVALEHFKIVTRNNFYLVMEFKETYNDEDQNPTALKLKLYIVRFNRAQQSKFLAYDVPSRISDETLAFKYLLDIYVPSDNLIKIDSASKQLMPDQAPLIGEHKF